MFCSGLSLFLSLIFRCHLLWPFIVVVVIVNIYRTLSIYACLYRCLWLMPIYRNWRNSLVVFLLLSKIILFQFFSLSFFGSFIPHFCLSFCCCCCCCFFSSSLSLHKVNDFKLIWTNKIGTQNHKEYKFIAEYIIWRNVDGRCETIAIGWIESHGKYCEREAKYEFDKRY